MKSSKRSAVAVCALAAAAVIFFVSIICVALLIPDDPYSEAQADYGMRYNYMNVNVEWKKDRTCHIKQELEAQFLDSMPSHGIYVDIPVNSGEKVRNLEVKATSSARRSDIPYSFERESGFSIIRIVVGDPDRTFRQGDSFTCHIEYDYITPKHPDGANILDINAIGRGWTSPVVLATVSVTFPHAPELSDDSGVWIGDGKASDANVVVENEGRTYTVRTAELQPFEGVRVKYRMPNGVLEDHVGYELILTIVLGAVLVAATVILMVLVGRDKPLTPAVDFYPPRIDCADGRKRHMLPVQMGKIIDGACSSEDVTSLIFYWANKGYLEIDEREDDIYLKKLCDADAVTSYERAMFDKIFSFAANGDDGNPTVAIGSLRGKFANTVQVTKTAVNREYSGKLYKRGFTALSALFVVLCMIYGAGLAVFTSLRINIRFFNWAGFVVLIPVIISAGLGYTLNRYYIKLSVKKRRLLLVLLFAVTLLVSVGTMLSVPTDVMSWTEKTIFALCLGASSAVAPFLTVRTDAYTAQLNDIIGFRDFLRDAEKDRLESMLKDDPQYYYNILPYANVLGVSKIWSDKFKDLTVEPPTYYRSYDRTTIFDIYIMTRIADNVGRSLTYVPPKANGGSFSGGRSGGGGSFGGFGGGGGGRW